MTSAMMSTQRRKEKTQSDRSLGKKALNDQQSGIVILKLIGRIIHGLKINKHAQNSSNQQQCPCALAVIQNY